MRDNPLIEPIDCILLTQSRSFSEYELIQQLQAQGWVAPIDSSDTLSLYSTHFVVYNALYRLQKRYQSAQKYLRISALDIGVIDVASNTVTGAQPTSYSIDQGYHERSAELQRFYLDWTNLDAATQQSVNCLLDSFWSRYVEEDELLKAFEVLNIGASSNYNECKQAYRKLAMQYHPDRGGSDARFQDIQQAFATLQRHFA